MLIRGLAAHEGQKMARERDGYQKLPKVTNLGVAPYIPPAVKASVIAGYTAGKSLRKLAIEFRLGRPTVTKIVNKLRQERLVELSRDRFKEFIDAALESYEFALREELDGKRAAEFLKAHGIIPTCGCNACARGKRLNAQQEKAAQSQTLASQPKLTDTPPANF
jgi:hypothetical protein